MKTIFKSYIAAWAVFVVIFNIIIFVLPSEFAGFYKFAGAFWSAYAIVMATLIGQLVCAYFAFKSPRKELFFLKLPLITISYTTLILSTVAGAICIIVPDLPNWVGIILCVLLLGFTTIAIIKATSAADIVTHVGDQVQEKSSFIRFMTAEAEMLMSKAKTPEAKSATKKVYEALRYSDPISEESLSDIEHQIAVDFKELSAAVISGKDFVTVAETLLSELNERNTKCRMIK